MARARSRWIQPSRFRPGARAPEWLRALWPAATQPDAALPVSELSPFLENFLIDAGPCWSQGGRHRLPSGPWVEGEVTLEATAMTAAGQAVLLIERLGEAFEAKGATPQNPRENVPAHQRLNAEMQKKAILLHCVAEDLTGSL